MLVTVAYRVPPASQREFTEAMSKVERDRRRSGAERWGLFRDLTDTDRFVETFVVDTWAEHLRQHQRRTRTADVLMGQVRQFVEGDVEVAHLVSAYSEHALDDPLINAAEEGAGAPAVPNRVSTSERRDPVP